MLNSYINPHVNAINQFIVINEKRNVIENESPFFKEAIGKPIKHYIPFLKV